MVQSCPIRLFVVVEVEVSAWRIDNMNTLTVGWPRKTCKNATLFVYCKSQYCNPYHGLIVWHYPKSPSVVYYCEDHLRLPRMSRLSSCLCWHTKAKLSLTQSEDFSLRRQWKAHMRQWGSWLLLLIGGHFQLGHQSIVTMLKPQYVFADVFFIEKSLCLFLFESIWYCSIVLISI